MPNGKYSKEFKDGAIELACKMGVSAAARQLDIPKSTLSRWNNGTEKAELSRFNENPIPEIRDKFIKISELATDQLIELLKKKSLTASNIIKALRLASNNLLAIEGINIDGKQQEPREIKLDITYEPNKTEH